MELWYQVWAYLTKLALIPRGKKRKEFRKKKQNWLLLHYFCNISVKRHHRSHQGLNLYILPLFSASFLNFIKRFYVCGFQPAGNCVVHFMCASVPLSLNVILHSQLNIERAMLHTVLMLSTVAGDCLPKQPQNYLQDIITKKLKKNLIRSLPPKRMK